MKKLMALLAVLMVLTSASCTAKQTTEQTTEQADTKQELTEQEIELVRQDIISEYGFGAVAWQSIEKVEHENGDFYVFTCIVQEDKMYQYTFAVRIDNSHGEIDVDTWRVYADEGR